MKSIQSRKAKLKNSTTWTKMVLILRISTYLPEHSSCCRALDERIKETFTDSVFVIIPCTCEAILPDSLKNVVPDTATTIADSEKSNKIIPLLIIVTAHCIVLLQENSSETLSAY